MARLKEKVLLCALFLGFMFLLNIGAPILASQSSQTVSSHGAINYTVSGVSLLHTSGTNIYDAGSNQVKLWGIVLQDGDSSTYSQSDFQTMKNYGFNTVKIWVCWRLVEPNGPTVTGTSYFTGGTFQRDNYVEWATQAGLYVILGVGISDTWPKPDWVPSGNIVCPDGGGSWSLTDSNTLLGQANMYGFMADRYYKGHNTYNKMYDNVIFEGENEMEGSSSDMTNFRTWNNNWISAVEANEGNTSHLKIIQFLVNYSGGTVTTYFNAYPPYISGTHSNYLMATHDYFMVTGASSSAPGIYSACQTANVPWIDTEFSTAIGGDYSGLQTACQAMTSNGISGWGYFCYNIGNQPSSYALPGGQAEILPRLQPFMTQP